MVKELPIVLKEEKVNVDYAILKFRKSKTAFKTEQNQQDILCYFKNECVGQQLHIHLMFDGKDDLSMDNDKIDVDFYIPIMEIDKIIQLLSSFKKDISDINEKFFDLLKRGELSGNRKLD